MLEQEGRKLCAACGADNDARASFCGVCGSALLEEVRLGDPPLFSEGASTSYWAEPLPAVLPGAEVPPAMGNELLQELQAPAQAETVEQKRCGWCSAMNPWAVAVCESCGARFPTPEQDSAFLRASEERLRAEEAEIDALRERRLRRNSLGWRWRFRL
jgi:ribosomal protein L40E